MRTWMVAAALLWFGPPCAGQAARSSAPNGVAPRVFTIRIPAVTKGAKHQPSLVVRMQMGNLTSVRSGVAKVIRRVGARNALFAVLLPEAGSAEVVSYLLASGANANQQSPEGDIPLHRAAQDGRADVVEALLRAKANVAARDKVGCTALHLARNADVARALLGGGAQADGRTRSLATPLHYAAKAGRADVIRVLLAAGASPIALDEDGNQAIHLAVEMRHVQALNALLDGGADPNSPMGYWRSTPLYMAVKNRDLATINVLLSRGACVSPVP